VASMRGLVTVTEQDDWSEDLFVSFVADVRGKSHGAFPRQVDRLLELLARDGHDPALAQSVVEILRRAALPALAELPGMLLRAEAALHSAGISIANALRSDGQQYGLSFHDASQVLGCIAQELTMRVGVEQIGATLTRYLPRLGIPSAGLALFRRQRPGTVDWTELEWRWTYGSDASHWWTQNSRSGLAALAAAPVASIVVPLTFENRLFGVASFEVGPLDGVVFETIRALVSSALAHASARRQLDSLCA